MIGTHHSGHVVHQLYAVALMAGGGHGWRSAAKQGHSSLPEKVLPAHVVHPPTATPLFTSTMSKATLPRSKSGARQPKLSRTSEEKCKKQTQMSMQHSLSSKSAGELAAHGSHVRPSAAAAAARFAVAAAPHL